jgi:hypothetical protein
MKLHPHDKVAAKHNPSAERTHYLAVFNTRFKATQDEQHCKKLETDSTIYKTLLESTKATQ